MPGQEQEDAMSLRQEQERGASEAAGAERRRTGAARRRSVGGVLRRRWPTMFFVTIASLALAGLYLAGRMPVYEGTAQLLLAPRAIVAGDPDLAAGTAYDAVLESQLRLLRSEAVLARVVDRLDLARDPQIAADGREHPLTALRSELVDAVPQLADVLPAPPDRPSPADPRDRAIEVLGDNIAVRRDPQSYVVEVTARAPSPEKAAQIANAVAAAYLAEQPLPPGPAARLPEPQAQPQPQAQPARDGRIEESAAALRAARDALARARAEAALEEDTDRDAGAERADLEDRLARARDRRRAAETRLEEVERLAGRDAELDAIPDGLRSEGLAESVREHAALARREAELSRDLGPRHPRMMAAREARQAARARIAAELRRMRASVAGEAEAARAEEAALEARLASAPATPRAPAAPRDFSALEDQVEEARRAYEAVLRVPPAAPPPEASPAETAAAPPPQPARLISTARVPERPASVPDALVLGAALLAGLALGALLALARDRLDDRLRTPAAVAAETGLPVLAVIPRVRGAGRLRGEASRRAGLASRLDVLDNPETPFAGAIRQLRDSLYDLPREGGGRAVLLTSTGEDQGTTFVALNLALSFTETGLETLLIDADPKRGLSRMVAPDAETGLIEAIGRPERLSEALLRDPRSGLWILPLTAGTQAAAPLGAGLKAVLERDTRFDRVVVDGPPLLREGSAPDLAAAAGQVVLCIRQDRARRRTMERARDDLARASARLRGLAITFAKPRPGAARS